MKKVIIIMLIVILIFPILLNTISYAHNEINNNIKMENQVENNIETEENKSETNNIKQENTTQNNTTQNNTPEENTTQNNTTQNNIPEENTTQNGTMQENTIKNNTTGEDSEKNNINNTTNIIEEDLEAKENISTQEIKSDEIKEGIYYIKSKLNENMVFDIIENSKQNSKKVQLWEKSAESTDNQKFKIKKTGNGYYIIEALHSGKVLDVPGAGTVNGTKVQQYESNGTDAQKWIIKEAGNGYYYIISKCNGLYLDIPGANAINGALVNMYEGNNSDAQKFKLEKVVEPKKIENGTYYIKSKLNTNMVLDVSENSKQNSAKIQLWEKSAQVTDNQKFEITYIENGYYTIKAKHSNKVLDVPGAGTVNGTKVQQYESNGTDAQKWIIKEAGNGYYYIISKCNGLYLDIPGANATNGVKINLYEGNYSDAQKFKLEKIEKLVGTKTIEDGKYRIKSAGNKNMVWDIDGLSRENGGNLQLWEQSDLIRKNQRFEIKYLGNGNYQIIAQHSKKVIEVAGSTNGSNVQQNDSNNKEEQKWIIKDNKDGTYSIISKANELYIDVKNGQINNGSNIQVYEGNGSNAQKFIFEEIKEEKSEKIIPDGVYKISTALDNNKVLDIDGGSYKNQANLQIWDKGTSQQQKFEVTYKQDGYYEIKATHSGKVLDVSGGSDANGTNVNQYETNGTQYQKWILKSAGNGYYYIISKGAEAYLSVRENSSKNGTKLEIYDGNGENRQKFKLEETQIIDENEYHVATALEESKVLDVDLSSSRLQIWTLNESSKNQKFKLEYLGNGYYKIICKSTKQVLTVNENTIIQSKDKNTDNQKWKIETAKNGYYFIKSKSTGLYLDIAGASSNDGTKLQIYNKNESNAQMFKWIEISNEKESNFSSINETKYPGYKEALQQLQNQHPNWILTVQYTGLDWNTVLDNEDILVNGQPKSLTQYNNEWRVDEKQYGTGWYRATRKAIAYMMDPRNSLDEGYIFQFQSLTSTAGTYSDIANMIQGTFLTKYEEYTTDSIINTILTVSKDYEISPFHLVSRMLQEQGEDGSVLNGYEYMGRKVYNLFNIGATGNSDEEIIQNAAKYAYEHHWFSPEMCINGSASFLNNGYFDKGQTTLYYQKYNVVDKNNLYNNQYMQNIRAANDEGNIIYGQYKECGQLDFQYEFIIPIYENMPTKSSPRPNGTF